jgi:hypothetical protein
VLFCVTVVRVSACRVVSLPPPCHVVPPPCHVVPPPCRVVPPPVHCVSHSSCGFLSLVVVSGLLLLLLVSGLLLLLLLVSHLLLPLLLISSLLILISLLLFLISPFFRVVSPLLLVVSPPFSAAFHPPSPPGHFSPFVVISVFVFPSLRCPRSSSSTLFLFVDPPPVQFAAAGHSLSLGSPPCDVLSLSFLLSPLLPLSSSSSVRRRCVFG